MLLKGTSFKTENSIFLEYYLEQILSKPSLGKIPVTYGELH